MEFVRLFKTVAYAYIIITLIPTLNSQLLLSGPEDVRAVVGTDVIFKCSAYNMVSPNTLIWTDLKYDNYIITFGESTFGSKIYSIIVSGGGSYDLKITNIQITNAGDYECTYGYYDYERSLYIYSSFSTPATATLTVLQPPSATSPRCLLSRNEAVILAETPLYVGESIRLQCVSEGHGSTFPTLGITVSDINVAVSTILRGYNYTAVESVAIIVENYDTELKCHLSSDALEETRTCTITLNVLLPKVEIYPSMQSVQEATDVNFQCSASNFKTSNLQYEWQISPYVPGDIFTQTESIFKITDISLNNNLLEKQIFHIVCFVRENRKMWNASTTLSITQVNIPTTNFNNDTSSESEKSVVGIILGTVVVAIVVILIIIVSVLNRQKLNSIIFRNKTINASVNDTPLYSDVQNMNTITPNADEGGDSCDNAAVYYSSVPNDADNYDNVCNINDNDEALYENRPFTRDVTELNVEGLNYAVLDLQESSRDIISTNHTTTYATLEN